LESLLSHPNFSVLWWGNCYSRAYNVSIVSNEISAKFLRIFIKHFSVLYHMLIAYASFTTNYDEIRKSTIYLYAPIMVVGKTVVVRNYFFAWVKCKLVDITFQFYYFAHSWSYDEIRMSTIYLHAPIVVVGKTAVVRNYFFAWVKLELVNLTFHFYYFAHSWSP